MRDLIDLLGHGLVVGIGLSTFAAAAADLEDGPTYTVGVASTDGKALVENMPVISHEWQLRDIALPGIACPNGYRSSMILRLRLTYIADDVFGQVDSELQP